jgi:glycosyltransferase involved in cell wall biosynthesis
MEKPVVSVCLITYNHEKYIEEAIESVLMQELDVPFEICIGEDDSSDQTRSICQSYAKRFPEKIKLFLRDRGTVIYKGGRPTGIYNFLETLKACSGEFIAILEGDDYWNYSHKLKEQIDFLRLNPEWSGCGHDCIVNEGDVSDESVPAIKKQTVRFTPINLLDVLSQGSQLPTASLLFRRSSIFPLPAWYMQEPSDWKLEVALLLKGELHKLDVTWSTYRIHPSGVYSGEKAIHQLNYRRRQAKELLSIKSFGKPEKGALRSYLAHTYRKYYPQLASQRPVQAVQLLLKFVVLSDMHFWIKIKHFSKTFFQILLRSEKNVN